jgi:hypothetical protein
MRRERESYLNQSSLLAKKALPIRRSSFPAVPRAFAIVVVIEFIRVGGAIQVEVKEKKNRVESAFNAPRATVKGRPSRRWHCPPARHPIAGQSEAYE